MMQQSCEQRRSKTSSAPSTGLQVPINRYKSIRLFARLGRNAPLTIADHSQLAAIPCQFRTIERSAFLQREGQSVTHFALIEDGLACRQKSTSAGDRQIVAFQMSGDFLNLQNLFLSTSEDNVQAVTRIRIMEFPMAALRRLVLTNASIGRAIWIEALVDAAICHEWILNIGRRNARARLAHLLCELDTRLSASGIEDGERRLLSITLEQFADALGLTSVHISRVLKWLAEQGVIERTQRRISVSKIAELRRIGDFSDSYLRVDQHLAAS
jgi:CRP-like cAMP-binding protein